MDASANSRRRNDGPYWRGHLLVGHRKCIAQKIGLAEKDHLAGIAMWQVGFANQAIYSELVKNIGKQP